MDPMIRAAATDQAADQLKLAGPDAFGLQRGNGYRPLIMVCPVPRIGR